MEVIKLTDTHKAELSIRIIKKPLSFSVPSNTKKPLSFLRIISRLNQVIQENLQSAFCLLIWQRTLKSKL